MSAVDAIPLLAAAGGDYQISRSVRLRNSATGYFNRTFASAGNQQKMTFSLWVKRGKLGGWGLYTSGWSGGGASQGGAFLQTSGDTIDINQQTNNAYDFQVKTTAVYRDPSAWYHIVVAIDTTQATAANRVIVYINGVQVTSYSATNYPSQNLNTKYNGTAQRFGALDDTGNPYVTFDGYFAECRFIDGQALTPSSFGEFDAVTGVWKPKKYTGTYGTNGWYLDFSDNSAATAAAIGKDYSGNGNNWTPNNISVTSGSTYDSMLDVPTPYADGGNGRGNYCVMNPLASANALTYANLRQGTSAPINFATFGQATGKWYWEVTLTTQSTAALKVGIANSTATGELGDTATGWAYIIQSNASNGQAVHNGSLTSVFSTFTTGDILNVAVDIDNGKIWWGKNGTWVNSGVPASGTGAVYTDVSGTIFPAASNIDKGGGSGVLDWNFGQRPFTYTPPTGFKALNTQNLPESTIKKGNQYFNATTYTGTGSAQSIVNSGAMQPDLVWIKNRNNTDFHRLTDSVRGASFSLRSDATTAEQTTNSITSFNSNGFSVGTENTSAYTYVGWQWKKGATQGFDIVTGTAPSSGNFNVSHSLGVTPAMIILKDRTTAGTAWAVWHKSLATASQSYLQLNSTNAVAANANIWGNTAPTSTQFTTQAGQAVIGSANYVAYLFAEVAGFSKFGSYTGNGSTDGPFVYCGFRPRWLLVKRTDSAGHNWDLIDTARDTYNTSYQILKPNAAEAQVDGTLYNWRIDITANGFKCRDTNAEINASGGTYIYAAFAENPFKNSLAR